MKFVFIYTLINIHTQNWLSLVSFLDRREGSWTFKNNFKDLNFLKNFKLLNCDGGFETIFFISNSSLRDSILAYKLSI